jgi:hypothetical protein
MSELSKQALQVENTTSFPNNTTGYITPTLLRSFNSNAIDSTVNQIVYTSDSGSWNSKINQLNAFTASQQPTFNALNSFTASQLTINSGVNGFTQSASGRLNNLEAYTASFTTSVGIYDESVFVQNVNQINFMGNGIIASYVSGKAVIGVDFTPLNDFTASQLTINSGYNSFTSSTNNSIALLNTVTASYATTGSNTFTQDQIFDKNISVNKSIYVGENIYVVGGIEATYIKTIYETSSVIYSSGSNQFGDSLLDIQILSGSTFIEGELYVNKLNVTSQFNLLNSFTASQLIINSGYNTTTASLNTSVTNLNLATASLYSYTSSTNIRLNNIETTTASLLVETQNLELFSASQLLKDSTLAIYTASVDISLSNINAFTQSTISRLDLISSFTGSYATTGSNTFIGNQNITGSLTITGSAFGNVVALSITSNTASMDLNLGNYFTLTLANTATTHISASNVQPGVSATLVITTGTNSSASLAPTMLQPSGSAYSATNGSAKKDVLSIVAVASGVPFVVSTKNMI